MNDKINSFEDLKVWQYAVDLTRKIHECGVLALN